MTETLPASAQLPELGTVRVLADDPDAGAALATALRQAGVAVAELADPATDADQAGHAAGGRTLLLLQSPAAWLCGRLSEPGFRSDPTALLQAWVERARHHLRRLLAHRSQCLAFDVDEFFADTPAAVIRLNQWLGTAAVQDVPPRAGTVDAILLRLAAEYTENVRESMDLHAELLACCEPLPAVPATPRDQSLAAQSLVQWASSQRQIARVSETEQAIGQARVRIVELESRVADLQQRVEQRAEQARDAEAQLLTQGAALSAAQDQLSRLGQQEQELRAELEAEQARHRPLELLLAECRQGWELTQQSLIQWRAEADRLAALGDSRLRELQRLHLEERSRWLHDWRSSLDALNAENAQLREDAQRAQRQLLVADDARAVLEARLSDLARQLAEFQDGASHRQSHLEAQLADARAELAGLGARHALAEQAWAERQRSHEAFVSDRAQAEAEGERERQALEARLAQAHEEASQLRRELSQLSEHAVQRQEESDRWRSALHEAQERIEQLTLTPPEDPAERQLAQEVLARAHQQLAETRTQMDDALTLAGQEHAALLMHLHETQELLDEALQEQQGLEVRLAQTQATLEEAAATRPRVWQRSAAEGRPIVDVGSDAVRLVHAAEEAPHRELRLEWPTARIGRSQPAPLRLKLLEHRGLAGIGIVRLQDEAPVLAQWRPNAREGAAELMVLVPDDGAARHTLDHLGASDWLVLLALARLLEQAVGGLGPGLPAHWTHVASRLVVRLGAWPERLRYDSATAESLAEAAVRVRLEGVMVGSQAGAALQLLWRAAAAGPELVLELDPLRPTEPPLSCWPVDPQGLLQPSWALPLGQGSGLLERVRWWSRLPARDRLVLSGLLDALRSVRPAGPPGAPAWTRSAQRLHKQARQAARLSSLASRLLRRPERA